MVLLITFLILPVLLAGLTFIFFLKAFKSGFLNIPLDGGRTIAGKRVLGRNKTIKGPLLMVIFSMLYGWLIYQSMRDFLPIQLSSARLLLDYLIIGLGYSLGELPNSFLKRRLGIYPGQKPMQQNLRLTFFLFDTFDSIVVIGALYIIFFRVTVVAVAWAILIGGLLHILTDVIMKKIGLKSV